MFFPLPVQISETRLQRTQLPIANGVIIALNVVVFLLFDPLSWGVHRAASPISILGHGFAHAGFWHLVFNMWVLWVFGNPVNRRLGNGYYLLAYLGAILTLGLFAYLFLAVPLVGASGAIYAVIGIAALLLPAARMTVIYAAVFPFTILLGMISRPKYGIFWFVRGGEFQVPVVWCLLFVPIMETVGMFCWWLNSGRWHWGHFGHLLGFVFGLGVVLLFPRSLTVRRSSTTWST
ncbi:Rhomboid protease GluP [Symmachiella dynata]|uniref:Rhomboid protease GluP n=1 Tax=Symmachiella dynata TaxID=2527995 RepID=A0A517ZQD0_9PLAN|nr:rhomboid family intramembrane serine protease [Symmachiella dynata]QDT49027.1 Rhomboid protease GluP [Symmachiella dynata]QDU44694.1 Rhomboid protease GluP [Symmachiella dynata]